jgi:secretion/DNA translocation related TadE-like protein
MGGIHVSLLVSRWRWALRRRGAARPLNDAGAATLWVLAVMGLVWAVAMAVMEAGGVRAARHHAHLAADEAALAAAYQMGEGRVAACRRAATIAGANGAQVTDCKALEQPAEGEAAGDVRAVVEVSVEIRFPGPAGLGTMRIPATARAGPSGEYTGPGYSLTAESKSWASRARAGR